MYQRTIEYEDYNGNNRKETFFFNLSKHQIQDLEWRTPGGIENYMKRVIETLDGQKMADFFKWLIKESYGVKDLEGRRFMQSEEIFKAFEETPAYDILYMDLATNDKAAAEFINGIFPKEAVEAVKKQKELAEKAGLELVPGVAANSGTPLPTPTVAPVVPQPVAQSVPPVQGQEVFTPVQ